MSEDNVQGLICYQAQAKGPAQVEIKTKTYH